VAELTHRQVQATLIPCRTIMHVRTSSHLRNVNGYVTLVCVTVAGRRLRWWVSVALFEDDHPIAIDVLSPERRADMEAVARQLLYLKEPPSQSVGKGRFDLAPGQFALNLYRELTDDEIKLLPEDWQQYPEARVDGRVPPTKG
jgi:hypothetical protein